MSFQKVEENKTERPEGRNCILVYGYGKHHFDTISEAASSVGISESLHLIDEHLGERIRDILENALRGKAFEEEITEPIIVMSALADAELHHFLDRFRVLGIPRPLFAAVTPTSRNWRFGDLALELGKERKEIAAARQKQTLDT